MFCPKCGANLPENSSFCGFCGSNISSAGQPYQFGQVPGGQPYQFGQVPGGQPNQFGQVPGGQPNQFGQVPGGQPNQFGQMPVKIKNYLVESILVTLFCCLPFGVIGIIYASKVNTCIATNDINGATQASNSAKNWILAGFICGLVGSVLYALMEIGLASML